MPDLTILRTARVIERRGCSRTLLHLDVRSGRWTKPIHLGPSSVGWPSFEVDAQIAARISGANENQLRDLVTRLEAARPSLLGKMLAEIGVPATQVARTPSEFVAD